MFSIAEDVFEGEITGRPLELTCYRRNLFQISGSITMSRSLSHVALEGRNANITELYASLSATESIEGKMTEIISVPWKTGVAGLNGSSSEDKSGSAPADIPIDLSSNQEDPVLITISIAWRRLQFKYATANNGRRKGLQQHYQVQIALMAKVEGENEAVRIAEIHSNPIVVRGRSPKNFDSSKDVPLSERKQSDPARRIGSQSGGGASVAMATPQWIEPAVMMGSGVYYAQQSFVVCLTPQFLSLNLSILLLLQANQFLTSAASIGRKHIHLATHAALPRLHHTSLSTIRRRARSKTPRLSIILIHIFSPSSATTNITSRTTALHRPRSQSRTTNSILTRSVTRSK